MASSEDTIHDDSIAKSREGILSKQTEEASKIDEGKLLWKIDLQVVPLCLFIYLLSFIDRTNIAFARNNGLVKELGLTPHDFYVALTVLYVPYVALEIPSNLLIKRIGPSNWIPLLLISWGIVSTLQGIVKTRTGLYINRAFLGAAEAGILPGLSLYISTMYRPEELHLRQALYFSGSSLSGAFSGLLATAIAKLNGRAGLRGWSWIFILEGIFTVLFGVLCFFILPSTTRNLWWTTEEEKLKAEERLLRPSIPLGGRIERQRSSSKIQEKVNDDDDRDRDQVVEKNPVITLEEMKEERDAANEFSWGEVKRGLTDPITLFFLPCFFANATSLYSVSLFSPQIIASLGNYTQIEAQLLTCPPFAAAFIFSVSIAFFSDRYRWRFPWTILCNVLIVIGFSMTYASKKTSVKYAGVFLLSMGTYSFAPILLSWISNLSYGHYKRATITGLAIMFTNSGGILSTWLWQNGFDKGYIVNLALAAFSILVLIALEAYLLWQRRMRKDGKMDWKVDELRKLGWSEAKIRGTLGDQHPEFELML